MKVIECNHLQGLNINHRRERYFSEQVSVITDEFRNPIVIRAYKSPTVISFCIWIDFSTHQVTGSGKAGQMEHAMGNALKSAGIKAVIPFNHSSHRSLMRDVATGLADYLKLKKYFIHVANA